jgi:hypothetical protein
MAEVAAVSLNHLVQFETLLSIPPSGSAISAMAGPQFMAFTSRMASSMSVVLSGDIEDLEDELFRKGAAGLGHFMAPWLQWRSVHAITEAPKQRNTAK